jgi:hypothetical protein
MQLNLPLATLRLMNKKVKQTKLQLSLKFLIVGIPANKLILF